MGQEWGGGGWGKSGLCQRNLELGLVFCTRIREGTWEEKHSSGEDV